MRAEVREAMSMARGYKAAVVEYTLDHGEFPADNAIAGIEPGSQIAGKYVGSLFVDAGVIAITFTDDSDAAFAGHTLILTPPNGQLEINYGDWTCSSADIDPANLPITCK